MRKTASEIADAVLSKIARWYTSDFIAGIDPTGEKTFQYGMDDARSHESGGHNALRRAVGTAVGAVGGAAVIPAVIGGAIGGMQSIGPSRGLKGKAKLLSIGKGMIEGGLRPYKNLYRGAKATRALQLKNRGNTLNRGQVDDLWAVAQDKAPAGTPMSWINKKPPVRESNRLLDAMDPQQMAMLEQQLGSDISGGAGMIGLSGLVSGGAAFRQYGKGVTTGKELDKSRLRAERAEAALEEK